MVHLGDPGPMCPGCGRDPHPTLTCEEREQDLVFESVFDEPGVLRRRFIQLALFYASIVVLTIVTAARLA